MRLFSFIVCLVLISAPLAGHAKSPVPSTGGANCAAAFDSIANTSLKTPPLSKDETVQKLISSGSVFDNESLYQYLDANPENTKKLIAQWYRLDPEKMIQKMNETIGEKYLSVMVNPRIGNHLDEFLVWAKDYIAKNGKNVNAFELRMAYAKHLGTRVVYRGVGLESDAAAELIRKKSGFSSFGKQKNGIEAYVKDLLNSDRSTDFYGQLEAKRAGEDVREATFMQSVSDYPKLASAVGYQYSQYQDKPVYLFKMKIPEIDLLDQTNLFANFRFHPKQSFVFDGGSTVKMSDPGVERMVYFTDISPDEILSWKKAGTPHYKIK